MTSKKFRAGAPSELLTVTTMGHIPKVSARFSQDIEIDNAILHLPVINPGYEFKVLPWKSFKRSNFA